jgi:hypothetical protein
MTRRTIPYMLCVAGGLSSGRFLMEMAEWLSYGSVVVEFWDGGGLNGWAPP